MTLEELRAEANRAARWRGHTMGAWVALTPNRAHAVCDVCGATVTVDTCPAPNDIDIAGSAVAVECNPTE